MIRALCSMALLTVCAGCATPAFLDSLPDSHSSSFDMNLFREGNYITYAHAFTDAAAESVRRSAERHCAQRKEVAVKTSGTCSLTRCTTNYQCMSQADAAAYLPQDGGKK